jgi:tetratricopeptide (TPR) repeat protein
MKREFQRGGQGCATLRRGPKTKPDPMEPANPQPFLPLEPGAAAAERIALQAALEKLRRAVAHEPESAWAWYHLGDTLLALQRPEEALPALRRAAELSPGTALFRYNLGLALYDLDRCDAAAREFQEIVAADPQLKRGRSSLMLGALTNLALSQEKLGRREEAIGTLLPALETAAGILFNLGFLHFRARQFDAALPFAQAAYAVKPNNEDVVHQYGAVLSELGRLKEAVTVLKQATDLEPKCAGAWYDLGLAHARLKHRKQARRCFLKSLKLEPGRAWPHYDLACLDALEGNPNAAFRHLQEAVLRGFREVAHLRRDADLRSLRRDARWRDLVRTLTARIHSNN